MAPPSIFRLPLAQEWWEEEEAREAAAAAAAAAARATRQPSKGLLDDDDEVGPMFANCVESRLLLDLTPPPPQGLVGGWVWGQATLPRGSRTNGLGRATPKISVARPEKFLKNRPN